MRSCAQRQSACRRRHCVHSLIVMVLALDCHGAGPRHVGDGAGVIDTGDFLFFLMGRIRNVALCNRNHDHAGALKPTTLALTGDRRVTRSPCRCPVRPGSLSTSPWPSCTACSVARRSSLAALRSYPVHWMMGWAVPISMPRLTSRASASMPSIAYPSRNASLSSSWRIRRGPMSPG
jgi:hypothetical protein